MGLLGIEMCCGGGGVVLYACALGSHLVLHYGDFGLAVHLCIAIVSYKERREACGKRSPNARTHQPIKDLSAEL